MTAQTFGALLTMAALLWMVSAALVEAWRLADRGRG